MENVLTAIFVMFLILFGGLRLTDRAISSQEQLSETWNTVMEERSQSLNTAFVVVDSQVSNSDVTFTLSNTGGNRLTDFDRWDVIVSYYDVSDTYRVEYLPYSAVSTAETWMVEGIYLDASVPQHEVFEREIFNPGEDLIITLRPSAAVGTGQALQATIVAAGGATASGFAAHNAPPSLGNNSPMNIVIGQNAVITNAMLQIMDTDNTPEDLIYTVISSPTVGMLIPSTTFSQAQINDGLVSYTHTGMVVGNDTFQFTVSDGEDVIGAYSFTIMIGS